MTGEFYKKLIDLDTDELRLVWDNNKGVRERVFDYAMDSACFWVDDYLHGLPCGAADYSIGGQGDYFTAKDPAGFLEWLKDVQRFYCLLPENGDWSPWPLIEKAEFLHHRMDELYYDLSDENYNRMEARRDEILEELSDKVQEVLSGEYEQFYDDENCFWYFVEMQDGIFGDDCWIDDTFILWNAYTVKECFA